MNMFVNILSLTNQLQIRHHIKLKVRYYRSFAWVIATKKSLELINMHNTTYLIQVISKRDSTYFLSTKAYPLYHTVFIYFSAPIYKTTLAHFTPSI